MANQQCSRCGDEFTPYRSTSKYCGRRCALMANAEQSRAGNRRRRSENPERAKAATAAWYAANREAILDRARGRARTGYAAIDTIRRRARRRGLAFELDVAWLKDNTADRCPVCRTLMMRGRGMIDKGSPTVDRIDNSRGYTMDNCWVICAGCNLTKGDRTPLEIEIFSKRLSRAVSVQQRIIRGEA